MMGGRVGGGAAMLLHLFRSSRDVILEEQGILKGWTKTGKIS
jgi:hypothetical protein